MSTGMVWTRTILYYIQSGMSSIRHTLETALTIFWEVKKR